MTLFRGLVAYPITPADAAGRVDTGRMSSLADRLARSGVDGIGVLGSTGSYMFLERGERRRALAAAIEGAAGRIPVSVGIGALRTDAAVALAQDAAKAGADGVLLAPVSYTPLIPDEVLQHVRTVADATDLPLCLYDNPTSTGFQFSDALLRDLAAIPTLAAVKRPAPAAGAAAWLAHQRSLFAPALSVGCSVDWHASAALLAGADAWHSVLAGILPEACLAILGAARSGDAERLSDLNAALEPVWASFRAHGSLRVVFAMAERCGLEDVVPPAPVLPLRGAARIEAQALVERLRG